ncbi:MAG TPA: PspC domain-containing protein [Acidimicrobiales bacterium]|nr:PspC domain-containing protein [Acidimicrobiales bacterium]
MSLIAATPGARDHRYIAEPTDPGRRPVTDRERPTPPSSDAPADPADPAGPTASTDAVTDPAAPSEGNGLVIAGNGSDGGSGSGVNGHGYRYRYEYEYGGGRRSRRRDRGHDGGPPWSRHAAAWHDGRHEHHHHVGRRLRSLRRDPDNRVLGGVCGAVSRATGVDATWVRIGFVLLAIASGVMVLIYAMAWLLMPMEGETTNIYSRAVADKRGIRLVAAILIPLLILVQLITSTLHVPFVGFLGWPTFIAIGVVILIWRNANETEKAFIDTDVVPLFGGDTHGQGRRMLIARVIVGAVIGACGIALLVMGHTTFAALRPVGGAALVVAAAVVIFGPWWLSLVRDLLAERQARALAEERAQMASHVHDSVLQTLALIQRSADDPHNVVRLARAQERELRAWLFEGRPPGAISEDATMLAEGVGLLQRQVEADHGIAVQVVMVGDCELDEALRALLDAAREATVNAAKWSGEDQVSVYAEVEPDTVMLYVRDRGRGFDPDAVPDDRQGIAQSIRGRMVRFGGSAVVRSAPGEGAEVQLSMPRRERVK